VNTKDSKIKCSHIKLSKNAVVWIDIFEAIVEILSIVSISGKIWDASLSGLKIYFSYKNKEKIKHIWLSLDKVIEDLILFLEHKKSPTQV